MKSQQVPEKGGDEGAKATTSATSGTTTTKQDAAGSTGSTPTTGVVGELSSLLKSLHVQGTALRARQVRQLQPEELRATLLDGGATHCLRQRRDMDEWEQSVPVTVKLATGDTDLRQCPCNASSRSAS